VPEKNGLESRRTTTKSYIPIQHSVDVQQPKHLNIMLGSICNLTCSYCCKQYSSAWYRDIDDHGPYSNHDRFNITSLDRIVAKIGVKQQQSSSGFLTLLDEISKFDQVEEIRITGGEPFLYNEFPRLLNSLTQSMRVSFYTGLGVDTKRLKKQIDLIENRSNLTVYVSAENCGSYYEFNRYGNSYKNFLNNLELLTDSGFSVEFNSVVSNLTIFGIAEFVETFKHIPMTFQFCNDPEFLAVNVVDEDTKHYLSDTLKNIDINLKDEIISNMKQICNDKHRIECAHYVKEFSLRRNLSLDIFPESMLKWLKI